MGFSEVTEEESSLLERSLYFDIGIVIVVVFVSVWVVGVWVCRVWANVLLFFSGGREY